MKTIFYTIACFLAILPASAQTQINFASRVVKDSLFIPWEIIYGPDDHIWFTQKNGYICRLDPASGQTDTLYHETDTYIMGSTGEGGMLGMALDPLFTTTRPYVYVTHEYLQGSNYKERVVRYTYAANALQSPVTLIDNITGATYHNGGRLLIVADKLYISTGDATVGANAQDLSSLNGKILRINLDGSIPSDNPIPGSPVWDWGHRNAEGLAFANNIIYSSEHGPNNDDEINLLVSGRNYGWPNVEGYCNLPAEQTFCADSNVAEPIHVWTPTIAPCGIEYYDKPMFPALQGSLLLATLKDQHLYRLLLSNTKDSVISVQTISNVNFGRLRDICISPSGSVFLSTSNSVSGDNGIHTDRIIELYDSTFTSVGNVTTGDSRVVLYPNPASNAITLHFNMEMGTARWNYAVTSAQGVILKSGSFLPQQDIRVSISSLASGIYFIRAWNAGTVSIVKTFVKN
ncbi:PQQ-dependent sugar dehydrogenase [Chitinophagaceae bacterium MMS25-I14]